MITNLCYKYNYNHSLVLKPALTTKYPTFLCSILTCTTQAYNSNVKSLQGLRSGLTTDAVDLTVYCLKWHKTTVNVKHLIAYVSNVIMFLFLSYLSVVHVLSSGQNKKKSCLTIQSNATLKACSLLWAKYSVTCCNMLEKSTVWIE